MKYLAYIFIIFLSSCGPFIDIDKLSDENKARRVLGEPNSFSWETLIINDNTKLPTITFSKGVNADDTLYCIGNSSSDCNIVSWKETTFTSLDITGLALSDGNYYLNLKSTRGPRESEVVSLAFSVDTTASANVGSLTSDSVLTNSLTSSPTFTYTDPGDSDFSYAEYCIGTSGGDCSIVALTRTPSNSFNVNTLSLVHNNSYSFNIRTVDTAENKSSFLSLSWTVDVVSPNPVSSLSSSSSFVSSLNSIPSISFTQPADSDYNDSEYCIGFSNGVCDVLAYTLVGGGSSFGGIISGLSLLDNTNYYITVKSIDNAGNRSSSVSTSFITDTTQPSPPSALTLSASRINTTSTTPTISFTSSDSSQLNQEEYCLESSGGSTCDIQSWTNVPSNSFNVSSLSLSEGDYVFRLRSCDLSSYCSNESTIMFTVDTTSPSTVSSLNLSSNLSNSNTNSPTITFTNPSDSDFQKTQYCIGTSAGDCSVVSLTDSPSTSFSVSSLSLSETTYYINVRSVDTAGNVSSYASSSWTVDLTNPNPVTAYSSNVTYVTTLNQIPIYSFTNPGGDYADAEFCVGTSSGSCDTLVYTLVGGGSVFGGSVSGISLTDNTAYYTSVRSVDTAGNKSSILTLSFVTDTTRPNPPSAVSLSSDRINNTTTTPNITFTSSDSSQLDKEEYCIDVAGGSMCEVVDWTTTPSNNFNVSSLSLSEGDYNFILRSCDTSGYCSSNVVSVFTVDTSPPNLVSGASLSASKTSDTSNSPNISFTNPSDSDFSKTQYCIGTSAGDCSILSLTDSPSTSFSISSLSLSESTYYVNIRSIDTTGNFSTYVTLSWTVDTSAPAQVTGLSLSSSLTNSSSQSPNISFTNPSDSDFQKTQYCIGTSAGDCSVVSLTDSPSTSFNVSSLSLSDGVYFVNLTSIDDVGNASAYVNSSWTVDVTNPNPISSLTAPDHTSLAESGIISFTASSSGDVNRYEYSLGTGSGLTDVKSWTSIATNTNFQSTGLSLSEANYYVNVRVVDHAGNISSIVSDSWLASSLPIAGNSITLTGIGSHTNRDITVTDIEVYNSKIYLCGFVSTLSEGTDAFVARLNTDLSYDTSFNTTGYHIVSGETSTNKNDQFHDLSIDISGNVWASGTRASNVGSAPLQLSLVKFQSNGTLDTSFSGDGIYINNDAGGLPDDGTQIMTDVYPTSTGPVLIFSVATSRPNYWKFTSTGALDTSFSGDGKASTSAIFIAGGGMNHRMISETRKDSNGDLLILGAYSDGTQIVSKLNDDMSIDNAFATSSVFFTSFSTGSFLSNKHKTGFSIDTTDNFYIFSTEGGNACILAVNNDGTFDNAFGTNGKSCLSGAYIGQFFDGLVQSDHFLAGGSIIVGANPSWFVSKLNLDGSLDTSFDTNGVYIDSIEYNSLDIRLENLSSSQSVLLIDYETTGLSKQSKIQLINH